MLLSVRSLLKTISFCSRYTPIPEKKNWRRWNGRRGRRKLSFAGSLICRGKNTKHVFPMPGTVWFCLTSIRREEFGSVVMTNRFAYSILRY